MRVGSARGGDGMNSLRRDSPRALRGHEVPSDPKGGEESTHCQSVCMRAICLRRWCREIRIRPPMMDGYSRFRGVELVLLALTRTESSTHRTNDDVLRG